MVPEDRGVDIEEDKKTDRYQTDSCRHTKLDENHHQKSFRNLIFREGGGDVSSCRVFLGSLNQIKWNQTK